MKRELLVAGGIIVIIATIAICTNEITKNQRQIISNQEVFLRHILKPTYAEVEIPTEFTPKLYVTTKLGFKPNLKA